MMPSHNRPTCRAFLGLTLLFLLIPWGSSFGQELSQYGNPFTSVTLGAVAVQAEVVKTPDKLYLGLGNRQELPEGRGMLFIMPRMQVQGFCMRDMHFPLDIIWIAYGKVAGIAKQVPHEDQRQSFNSPVPVNYVLEVPAGFCDKYGIKVNDPVTFELP
jgi:hypothetical protein